MTVGKDYIIQFVRLSQGNHLFEYLIKDKFFENFEFTEITQSNIQVKINLVKQSTMMVLQFEISGTIKATCDLCTGEFNLPIEGNYKLIAKLGGHDTGNIDDDIITLDANEHQLNVAQFIYEYIVLSLPLKRVHPLDKKGQSTCDKEMIKKLKKFLIEKEKHEKNDPRWDELKNIKLN